MPVPSRGRKGSRSRADCLSLPPSSSHTGWERSPAEPLLLGTVARTEPHSAEAAACRMRGAPGPQALQGELPELPHSWKLPLPLGKHTLLVSSARIEDEQGARTVPSTWSAG